MARGKLKQKRCPNGSRRNKKTKKCVKRLNPKAKTFSMIEFIMTPEIYLPILMFLALMISSLFIK